MIVLFSKRKRLLPLKCNNHPSNHPGLEYGFRARILTQTQPQGGLLLGDCCRGQGNHTKTSHAEAIAFSPTRSARHDAPEALPGRRPLRRRPVTPRVPLGSRCPQLLLKGNMAVPANIKEGQGCHLHLPLETWRSPRLRDTTLQARGPTVAGPLRVTLVQHLRGVVLRGDASIHVLL